MLQIVGKCPIETTTGMNGRIMETAAPEANITARAPGVTDISETRSTFNVSSGIADETELMTGNRSLVIEDLPIT